MLHKALALVFALTLYNLIFFKFIPDPGTTGFLILVAAANIFVVLSQLPKYAHFLTHSPSKNLKSSIGLATIAQLISIIAVTLAIFKGSEVDRVLLTLTSLGLTGIGLYLSSLEHNIFGAVSEVFFSPFIVAGNYLSSTIKSLENITPAITKLIKHGAKNTKPASPLIAPIIRGLIITVPIVFVVIGLLTSADPVFGKLISNLLNIKLPDFTVSERLTGSLILTLILIPLSLLSIDRIFKSPLNSKGHGKSSFELTMLTGTLTAILGSFILIQFRYLFASVPETALSQFGVATYSEYVRRGFAELTMVSIIVYMAAGLSFVVARAKDAANSLQTKINLALLAEVSIFILSIFRRVFLYATHHGLTRIRIYGSVFLLIMLALTAVLILRQIIKTKRNWYLAEASIILGGIFLATNIGVDRIISSHFPPHVNTETDYIYISRLSADADQGWVESYNWAKNTVGDPALAGKTKFEDFSDNQIRHILYSNMIITNTWFTYMELARDYGTNNQKSELEEIIRSKEPGYYPWTGIPYYTSTEDYYGLNSNLRAKSAFQKLNTSISPQDLDETYSKSQALANIFPPERAHIYYDRSLDSPLVD